MSTDNFGALGAGFFIKTFNKGSTISQTDLDDLVQYIQLTTTVLAIGDFTPDEQESVWMILERVDVTTVPDYTVTNNTDVTMTSGGLVTINSMPWSKITGKPSLFSGDYNDLTNKPTLFTANQTLNTGNSVSFNRLTVTGATGIEGGEIQLAKAPSSSLAGDVIIDIYDNKIRFFESGGTSRGFYLDLTTGANNTSTNIMSGGGTGAQGPTGNDGAAGAQGPQGEPGAAGAQGEPGADGAQGPAGNDGAPGQGVPTGGTVGQVLAKIDGTDYNTEWVNQTGGSGPTNEITNTDGTNNYSVSVATNGVISMTTSRGGLEFGALPEPGGPSHFHIMRPASENGSGGTDLYFGDDYNYMLQRPAQYGSALGYGVEIGANDRNGGDQHVWRFGTDGKLQLPAGGTITEGVVTDNPTIQLTPATPDVASQKLVIKGGGTVDYHLHLTTGDLAETSIFLGTDDHNVRTTLNGNIEITTPNTVNNVWEFRTDGDLTAPGNIILNNPVTTVTTSVTGTVADSNGNPFTFRILKADNPQLVTPFADPNFVLKWTGTDAGSAAAAAQAPGGQGPSSLVSDDGTYWNFNSWFGLNSSRPNTGTVFTVEYGVVVSDTMISTTETNLVIEADAKQYKFGTDGNLTLPAGGDIVDSTGATAFVSLTTLKQIVADSTDFADFQSRIAGMS